MEQAPPPPERPEQAPFPVDAGDVSPAGGDPLGAEVPSAAPDVEPQPNWPPRFAFMGFFGAMFCTLIFVGIVLAIAGVPEDTDSPAVTVAATLIQGVFFVGAALLLARLIAPPRLWHFGLRRAPLWRTIGWAAVGMVAFYFLTAVYAAIVDPQAEQDITESLGADTGTLGLIAAGTMVIVIAPFVEELFFRGFFYRALRTRYPIALAVLIDAVLFGLIHFSFESADALLILPPLAFLGAVFCLVYEKTKSLWAVIGMHAFNNTIAYSAQVDDGWKVGVVAGPLMLVACAAIPRLMPDGPASLPPLVRAAETPGPEGPRTPVSLPSA